MFGELYNFYLQQTKKFTRAFVIYQHMKSKQSSDENLDNKHI